MKVPLRGSTGASQVKDPLPEASDDAGTIRATLGSTALKFVREATAPALDEPMMNGIVVAWNANVAVVSAIEVPEINGDCTTPSDKVPEAADCEEPLIKALCELLAVKFERIPRLAALDEPEM